MRLKLSAAFFGLAVAFSVIGQGNAGTKAELESIVKNGALPPAVRNFYTERNFAPAWEGETGDQILARMRAIALKNGIDPSPYEASASGAAQDVAITALALKFGSSLSIGHVIPAAKVGGLGEGLRPPFHSQLFLKNLVAAEDKLAALENLSPPFAGYMRLRQALLTYQTYAQKGWPLIPAGPTLRPGQSDERLPLLAERLQAEGFLGPGLIETSTLNGPLLEALMVFQERNGLTPDGSAGPQTLAALNVTAEQRVTQIKANMERWRWMPDQLDSTHISVNIPAAHLELVEDGEIKLAMRVVVGDVKSPTPTMVTSLRSIVLNPTWTVPGGIATREILPKLKRDPAYLVNNNMYILDAFPEGSPESQGAGIDWNAMNSLPYRLRQASGPDNALGQIKFNLTDSDGIYLHDTPRRQYFDRLFRALSHGCVRLERPMDLAQALIAPEWAARIPGLIESAETKTLLVRRPITVYLMYMTAWADDDGTVHFRDDLYGLDRRLIRAMSEPQKRQASLP